MIRSHVEWITGELAGFLTAVLVLGPTHETDEQGA
jgi:hypothetical protein